MAGPEIHRRENEINNTFLSGNISDSEADNNYMETVGVRICLLTGK